AISILYLVTRCNGSTYASQCLSALCNNGQSGHLLSCTTYTNLCIITRLDLDSHCNWISHIILGIFKCDKTVRFERYLSFLNCFTTRYGHVNAWYRSCQLPLPRFTKPI